MYVYRFCYNHCSVKNMLGDVPYDLLCAGTISQVCATHVLEDDLTVTVLVPTRVLVGPFNGED